MPKEKKEKKGKKDKRDKSRKKKGSKSKSKLSKKSKKSERSLKIMDEGVNEVQNPEICPLHKLPLQMWCVTCQEPVCQQCVTYGPHNNQLHKVVDLSAAYRATVSNLSHTLSSSLLSKRDLLLAQIHRLSYRMDEISYARSIIEKDARGEFSGVIDRLKEAEGEKVAVIQNEMSQLQNDIEKIDTMADDYEGYRKNPLEFLMRYRNLKEEVGSMISKPFKKDITETPYDLPRELADLRMKIQRKNTLPPLLKLKSEIIWNLFKKKKNHETETVERFNRITADEVKAWAGLTDKYTKQLEKFQMICYYCGEILSVQSINKKCSINTNHKNIPETFSGFTQGDPPSEYKNSQWHYFSFPKQDLFKNGQAFSNLQKLFSTQQASILKKGLLLQIEKNLAFVRKRAREKNINVVSLFKEYDTKEIGIMSKAKFTYLLYEILEVDQPKIKSFLELLDPEVQGVLNYNEFLELLNDPKMLKAEKEYGRGADREMMPPRQQEDMGLSEPDFTEPGDSKNPSIITSKNRSMVNSSKREASRLKSGVGSRSNIGEKKSSYGEKKSSYGEKKSSLYGDKRSSAAGEKMSSLFGGRKDY